MKIDSLEMLMKTGHDPLRRKILEMSGLPWALRFLKDNIVAKRGCGVSAQSGSFGLIDEGI